MESVFRDNADVLFATLGDMFGRIKFLNESKVPSICRNFINEPMRSWGIKYFKNRIDGKLYSLATKEAIYNNESTWDHVKSATYMADELYKTFLSKEVWNEEDWVQTCKDYCSNNAFMFRVTSEQNNSVKINQHPPEFSWIQRYKKSAIYCLVPVKKGTTSDCLEPVPVEEIFDYFVLDQN